MIDIQDIIYNLESPEPDSIWDDLLDEAAFVENHVREPEHAYEKFCTAFSETRRSLCKKIWIKALHEIAGTYYIFRKKKKQFFPKDTLLKKLITTGLDTDAIVIYNREATIFKHKGFHIVVGEESCGVAWDPYSRTYVTICDTLEQAEMVPLLKKHYRNDTIDVSHAPVDDVADTIVHPEMIWESAELQRCLDKIYRNNLPWYRYYLEKLRPEINGVRFSNRIKNLLKIWSQEDDYNTPDNAIRRFAELIWDKDIRIMKSLGVPVAENNLPDYEQGKSILWEIYLTKNITCSIDNMLEVKAETLTLTTLRKELEAKGFKIHKTRAKPDPWESSETTDGFWLKQCGVEIALTRVTYFTNDDTEQPGLAAETRTANITSHSIIEGLSPQKLSSTLSELDTELALPETRGHFDEVVSAWIKSHIKKMTKHEALDGDYENEYSCPRQEY